MARTARTFRNTARPIEWAQALARAVADLTLGRACAGCNAPGTDLCLDCARAFTVDPVMVHFLALDDVFHGLRIPVWAGALYEGGIRSSLIRFKDHGHRSLQPVLTQALATSIRAAMPDSLYSCAVIPIPSRASAVKRRGADPLSLLARSLPRYMPCDVHVKHVLVDDRRHGANKHLGSTDRALAASGAFHVKESCHHPAIVIDDIITTGATLAEACSTLLHAGIHVVGAACIAHTPRN